MPKTIFFLLLCTFGYTQEMNVAQISEAIGHFIGKNLQGLGVDFDLEALSKGLKEEAEGKDSPLTEEQCMQGITQLQDQKITSYTQEQLQKADEISNGYLIESSY